MLGTAALRRLLLALALLTGRTPAASPVASPSGGTLALSTNPSSSLLASVFVSYTGRGRGRVSAFATVERRSEKERLVP